MTSKDKPKRPGGKPAGRDHKPRGASAAPGKKPFSGAKPAAARNGERPGKPFSGKPAAGRGEKAERPAPAAVGGDAALAPERISKLLARAGIASRRDIERMIMEGRVSLNGKILETPVVNATFADQIEVDGERIRGIERTRLWLYHKPAGLVTTNADPEGRPTVFENLPEDLPRVISIGRLDINTEGLLLLTNDGGLARVLELPTTGWLRRYRVRAHGKIEQAQLDTLKEGIAVDGVLYGAIDATLDKVQGSNVWLTLALREGKNREVKNVLGSLGLEVNRLIRLSYGPFQLGDLPEGQAQEIRGRTLRDQLGPRLVEEAKANFDAPLFDGPQAPAEEEPVRKAKPAGETAGREWGGPAKRADRREPARDRLDTKRDDRFPAKRGEGRDRDDRFEDRPKARPPAGTRRSNVWMAPGARPVAERKAEEADGPKREPRLRPEGAPKTKRYGRTAEGTLTKSARKFDPDHKGPARPRPQGGAAMPPRVLKTRDEDGEWIRAGEPEPQRDEGGFGRKRSPGGEGRGPRDFGDRPPRSERAPRAEGERSFGDRPPRREGAKPFGNSGKPAGGRPGKPLGGKPSGGKPGGRPFGGKPAGGGRPRGRGK